MRGWPREDNPGVATGVPMAAAGPSSAHTELRHYDHDAWRSITDTILLPEQGAILGALAPVFVPSAPGERRSVTVFYPAMSHRRADKMTGREEMSAIVGSELRRKSGRIERARQRRATARVSNMDEKLARGRALVRPCAAATVTVPNSRPIAEYGRRLDASIRLAGFIPQRLDGAQDSGFAAGAIPLGIGVPRRRGPDEPPNEPARACRPSGRSRPQRSARRLRSRPTPPPGDRTGASRGEAVHHERGAARSDGPRRGVGGGASRRCRRGG